MRDLSIYIHIPFCERKCLYCDFLSYPASETERQEYLNLLLAEIKAQAPFYKEHRVISVFIGGGTPSVLDGEEINNILCKLKTCFFMKDVSELTIEVNPGTVTKAKLAAYRRAGINRLSIGLQSANDKELKTLGRIHDYGQFCQTYELARKMGYQNINIDLMSAIPGQTQDSYRETIEKVVAYEPEHISAYSLILEEGTWFYEHQKELPLPTEEEDRRLYELTGELLAKRGYHRYEISNYARDGFECAHNKVYWRRGDYVGFGLGAASMVEEVRFENPRTFAAYRRKIQEVIHDNEMDTNGIDSGMGEKPDALAKLRTRIAKSAQCLSREEQMEEFMFLGLRLMEGIDRKVFLEKFGIPMEQPYGETLLRLRRDGLLYADDPIRLTPYGVDISNYVMAQF